MIKLFTSRVEYLISEQSKFIAERSDLFKDLENTKKSLQIKLRAFREKINSKQRDVNTLQSGTGKVTIEELSAFEHFMDTESKKVVLLKKSIGLKLNEYKKQVILLFFKLHQEQLGYFESNYVNIFDNMVENRKSFNPIGNFDTFIKEGECKNLVSMLEQNETDKIEYNSM